MIGSKHENTGSFVTLWAERTQQSKSDPGAQPSPGAPKQRMTRKGCVLGGTPIEGEVMGVWVVG